MTDTNNVLDVKRRALKAAAVQFTGKNGKEVVEFIKEYGGYEARNGGAYVNVTNEFGFGLRARKGDYVVIDADGTVKVLESEVFSAFFLVKG